MAYEDDLKAFIESSNKGTSIKINDTASNIPLTVQNFDTLNSVPVEKLESQLSDRSGKPPLLPRNPNASKTFNPTASQLAKSDATGFSNGLLYDDREPGFLSGFTPGLPAPLTGPWLEGVVIDTKKYNYFKWSAEPEDPKNGWFKNLPFSITKLPGRLMISMLHDYPKEVVQELDKQAKIINSKEYKKMSGSEKAKVMIENAQRGLHTGLKPLEDFFHGLVASSGLYDIYDDTVNGRVLYIEKTPIDPSKPIDVRGNPNKKFEERIVFSLPTFDRMKEMWEGDPAGTAALYMPFLIHSLARGAAANTADKAKAAKLNAIADDALNKARASREQGENIVKMKNESIARQVEVAKDEGFLDTEGMIAPQKEGAIDITGAPVKKGKRGKKSKKKKAVEEKPSVQKMNEGEEGTPVPPTPEVKTPEQIIDDVKNHSTDKTLGTKVKPLKNPEESEFFQDERSTFDKTELMKEYQDEIMEDPDLYLSSLINEVNRWYHGHEGADINLARRRLSELSAKIDGMKDMFRELDMDALEVLADERGVSPEGLIEDYDYSSRFEDFKATVQKAAQWSKRLQQKGDVNKTAERDLTTGEKPKYGTVGDIKFFTEIPIDRVWDPIRKLWVINKDSRFNEPDIKPGTLFKVKYTIILDGEDVGGISEKVLDWLDNVPKREPTKNEWKGLIDEIRSTLPSKEALTTFNRYCAELDVTKDYYNILSIVEALNRKGLITDEMMKNPLKLDKVFKSSNVTKLYSGVDPTEAFKKIGDWFAAVRKAKEESFKADKSAKVAKWFRRQKRHWVSQSANIKTALMGPVHADTWGYETLQSMNLATSATSRSAALADQYKNEILGDLSPLQREALDEVVFARRTRTIIDRDEFKQRTDPKYKAHKNPGGFGREYWQAYIDSIGMKGLSEAEVAEVYRRADMLFDIAKDQLKQLHEEGLITTEVYDDLKHLDYQRRQMIDIVDPPQTLGGKKIDVRESGIQELSVGHEKQLLETDSIKLMEELVIRTQNRIMANRAAKDLYKLAESNPESPLVRLKRPDGGWEAVHCFIEGQKKAIYMPKEFAQEWVTKNREVSYEFGKFGRLVSGSSIVRSLATGINIGFAIKNLFRDFAFMWIASQHYTPGAGWTSTYSTLAPKAIGQMALDIKDVYKDVFYKEGIYKDMVEDGVLLDFLSNKDRIMKARIGKEGNKNVNAIIDALHWASTYSELIGRAAIYKRALKKGLSRKEAAFLSRDYMFFGDYGTYTKAVDAWIPYFGATIKATEGIVRSWQRNPKEAALKAIQAMLAGATLYMVNNYIFGEDYEKFSKTDRENNVILPVKIPYKGTDGKQHYLAPKLPKDASQAFFMMAGENFAKVLLGKEVDTSAMVASLKGLSPIQGVPAPPSLDALYTYLTNTDTYTLEKIWHGEDVGTGMFDRGAERITSGPGKTHPVATAVGDATGLSPVRLSKALESMVPRNYITDAFSGLTRTIFDRAPADVREGVVAEMLATDATFRGLLASTDDMNGTRDEADKLQAKETADRVMHNGKISSLVEEIYKYKSKSEKELYDYIDSIEDEGEAERLEKRADLEREILELPHRSYLKRLHMMDPEAGAKSMFLFKRRASDQEWVDFLDEFDTFDSVEPFSERFIDEFDRLEEEYQNKTSKEIMSE